MLKLVFVNLPKAVNGKVAVILSDPKQTSWYKDRDGNLLYNSKGVGTVDKFSYLVLKKEMGSIEPSDQIKRMFMKWVILNAPTEALKTLGIA